MGLARSDKYTAVGYIGGKGSGKTAGGARVALQLSLDNPHRQGMITAPTYHLLTSVALIEWEAVAGDLIADKNENKRLYRMRNGALVWFSSADREYSLEGKNLSWAWIDEAQDVSHAAYKNILARLRVRTAVHRCCVVTGTPVSGTWLQREFATNKPRRAFIRVNTRENFYNSDDYIETLLSSLSAAEAQAYIDGQWLAPDSTNRVYPEFDPAHHVIDYKARPGYPVFVGVDFGYRWPYWCAAQRRDDGSLVVFAEDVIENISTEGLAARLVTSIQSNGWMVDYIACDPAGSNWSSTASDKGGVTNANALRNVLRAGGCMAPVLYHTGPGTGPLRAVNTGCEKIRGLLRNARGDTALWLSSALRATPGERGLIKALINYQWSRDRQTPAWGEAVQQADHACDGLRYMVLWSDRSRGGAVYRMA